MSRRSNTNPFRPLVAALIAATLAATFALPALAGASSGGASLGSAGAPPGGSSAQPGNLTVTVSGGGFTLSARISVLLHHELRFFGQGPSSSAGKTIVIQRLDPQAGWVDATRALAAGDGSFSALWRSNLAGRFQIRLAIAPTRSSSAHAASDLPTLQVTVYRPAIATIFGEGFFGQQTACGKTLRRQTLGVANRTLPCGTKVAIYYRAHTIVVPVIDRGPYANGADWDLTEATANALGMRETDTIGAARVSS